MLHHFAAHVTCKSHDGLITCLALGQARNECVAEIMESAIHTRRLPASPPPFPLRSETWGLLERALNEYGFIVDGEKPPKLKRKTAPGWFHYGYFVKDSSNILRAAGESFASTPDTLRKGDSLGVKSGVEGVVVSVIRAENPDLHDFDVFIVVEERLSSPRKQITNPSRVQPHAG
jgi:hypothetical protein